MLRYGLQKMIGESSATIGVSRFGPYFYTVMPAAEPPKSDKVKIQLQDPGQKADFFLVGFTVQISGMVERDYQDVEGQGAVRYKKSYNVRPGVFGRELQLMRFSQDTSYSLPTILFFRARAET